MHSRTAIRSVGVDAAAGFLAVCIFSLLSLAGLAAGRCDDWRQSGHSAAGNLYHRCQQGSPVPWVMIRTHFEAPPARLHTLVTDYDSFEGLIPNVAESRMLEKSGDIQWVYHRLHFSGPITDRTYIIRSTDADSRPQAHYYRVVWELADRKFPGIDTGAGVQPGAFSGFWEIWSADNGLTSEARYAVHSDPGGWVPGWLVAGMTDRYVGQVIAAIGERLEGGQ
jgi:hypothetical protein